MTPFRTVWRKSTRSEAFLNCVEVGRTPRGLGIRDSKNPGQIVDISAPSAVRFLTFLTSRAEENSAG
ncbi:DUF397 domain-containing protein [Actinokineospora globicatena]|uniref:DUF397 domain-containing protein n=1 Tax=Actinokineospora globicatena TaxID=103729 RepID=UPI0020A60D7F|nr:DUF397 domain-containing protein [Actinokineospora globicatena]MCP2304586.1 protein of unknown function (DUF397) [Actinokineospora globicatena]